jgi:hypothetical protein
MKKENITNKIDLTGTELATIEVKPRTVVHKKNKAEAMENKYLLEANGIIQLFVEMGREMLPINVDVELRHDNDWSCLALGWDLEERIGDQGRYTVGKGIFAHVSDGEIFITYSGVDSGPYLVNETNKRDLVRDGREKAKSPMFS